MLKKKAGAGRRGTSVQNDVQGRIVFEKTMKATSVSGSPPQLTLPIHFVREHSDEIQKYVTLRRVTDGRRWTVYIHLNFQPRLQALFHGASWKAFVAGNDLVVGDRVTFVLVSTSMFDVHILRSSREQAKGDKLPSVQMPSDPSILSERKPKESVGPRARGDMAASIGGKEKPNIALNSVFAKETAEVNHVADSAAAAGDASQMPSDMDSHFFEPMELQNDQECMSRCFDGIDCDDQGQGELPNFLKRLTMHSTVGNRKRLEIPCKFWKTHRTRIGTSVKLQGIHEASPVQDVACSFSSYGTQQRLLLTSGWSKFVTDNFLRSGERVIFILIADSFFAVRNI